jgi:hypothetical protein
MAGFGADETLVGESSVDFVLLVARGVVPGAYVLGVAVAVALAADEALGVSPVGGGGIGDSRGGGSGGLTAGSESRAARSSTGGALAPGS